MNDFKENLKMEKVEIIVNSDFDVVSALTELKQPTVFKFESISSDEAILKIGEILKYQVDNLGKDNVIETDISIKALSKEEKIAIIKHILTLDDVLDSYVILNIYNFIKGFNTFDSSYFDSPIVYVNDMEEYLDIKYELKEELSEFTKKVCVYYLSVLRSIDKIDNNDPKMVIIPLIIQRILMIADFYTLSVMLNKVKSINIDETYIVNNALAFVNTWAGNQVMSKELTTYMDKVLNINLVEQDNGNN